MRPNDESGNLPLDQRPFRILIISGSERRQYNCPGVIGPANWYAPSSNLKLMVSAQLGPLGWSVREPSLFPGLCERLDLRADYRRSCTPSDRTWDAPWGHR